MTDRDGKDVDTGTPPERYRADNRIGCKHTTVPFELHDDPDIDAFGLAVYSALLTAADFGTGRNAWPSRGTLADRAGCAERAVDGRLDVLNRRGWISRQPRKGKTTLYTVHFTRRMDAEYTPAGDAAVDETPAGDAGVPLQEMRTPLQEMQGTPAADADDRAPFTKHPSQHPSTKQEVESEGCADRDEVETENGAFRGGDGAGPDISASSDPPGLFERFL
ncbi:MAG TPA: hypothetical protein VKA63_04760, partial [Candidatus Krumholzibacteria bacterium]|nr:hypothetical protein [Candidatus Krumholzibacteria bacterium]